MKWSRKNALGLAHGLGLLVEVGGPGAAACEPLRGGGRGDVKSQGRGQHLLLMGTAHDNVVT